MIIAVDIDNILNNLAEKTIELYNSRTSKNIKIEDLTTYNFFDCLPREDAECIVKLFKEESLWDSLKPLHGSQDGIRKLIKNGHKIYLATATDVCNFAWKSKWINQHYPFIPQDNMIRICDKSILRCDILVDDSIDNLTGCFCERICLDYPWNHNDIKDYVYDIYRCYDWADIINTINKIERKNEEWDK